MIGNGIFFITKHYTTIPEIYIYIYIHTQKKCNEQSHYQLRPLHNAMQTSYLLQFNNPPKYQASSISLNKFTNIQYRLFTILKSVAQTFVLVHLPSLSALVH